MLSIFWWVCFFFLCIDCASVTELTLGVELGGFLFDESEILEWVLTWKIIEPPVFFDGCVGFWLKLLSLMEIQSWVFFDLGERSN